MSMGGQHAVVSGHVCLLRQGVWIHFKRHNFDKNYISIRITLYTLAALLCHKVHRLYQTSTFLFCLPVSIFSLAVVFRFLLSGCKYLKKFDPQIVHCMYSCMIGKQLVQGRRTSHCIAYPVTVY